MRNTAFRRLAIVGSLAASCLLAADPAFLRRQLSDCMPRPDDLTAGARSVSYKPIFGIGDQDADQLKGVARYGELTVAPGGSSAVVGYPAEEQIYFVTEGNGTLLYDGQKVPVKKNDFMYLPVGIQHGIANSSDAPVRVLVMGYRISPGTTVAPTPKLLLANAGDVQLQVLPGHGPTTQFKLLMGATTSERDKLAAAYGMNSLFIMDFAPGGTNNPHSHRTEEEIYILFRGSGDMVAGVDASGKDARHPVKPGDAFFYKPGARVGYFSAAKEGQEHDLILAVRSRLPR